MRVPKLCVCFLTALLFFSGCGDKTGKDAFKKTNAEITNDTTLDLCIIKADTLNPLRTTVRHNAAVLSLLYDSLFVLTDENEAVPDLCTNLSVSEDGRKVTVSIRENVFFHDGTPLKPQDVTSSVNFILSSDGFYKGRLSCVEKAQTNGEKIEIFLNRDTENVSRLFDFPILPERFLEVVEEGTVLQTPIMGSGLYFTEEYRINRVIKLKLNKKHHSASAPEYETINIHLLPDEKTAIYMLENKELDVISESVLREEDYVPPNGILSAPFPTERLVFLGTKKERVGSFVTKIQPALLNWILEEEIGKPKKEPRMAKEISEKKQEKITLLYCLDSFTQTRTAQRILHMAEEEGTIVMGEGVEKKLYFSKIKNGSYDLYLGEMEVLPNRDEDDFLELHNKNSPAKITGLFYKNEMLYFHTGVEIKTIKSKNPYLYFTGRQ